MSAGRARRLLAMFGVALTAALTTAGLLVVYNIQEDRQRVTVVCAQVAELRADLLEFLDARGVADTESVDFRPITCPAP